MSSSLTSTISPTGGAYPNSAFQEAQRVVVEHRSWHFGFHERFDAAVFASRHLILADQSGERGQATDVSYPAARIGPTREVPFEGDSSLAVPFFGFFLSWWFFDSIAVVDVCTWTGPKSCECACKWDSDDNEYLCECNKGFFCGGGCIG